MRIALSLICFLLLGCSLNKFGYTPVSMKEALIESTPTSWMTLQKVKNRHGKLVAEIEYRENRLYRITNYINGTKHGMEYAFNEKGRVRAVGEWRDGKPYSGWCLDIAIGDAGSAGGLYQFYHFKNGEMTEKGTNDMPR